MAKKKYKVPEKKTGLKSSYVVLSLVIIAALAIYFFNSGASNSGNNPTDICQKLNLTSPGCRQLDKPAGNMSGKIEILEFLKFDCPHCIKLHNNLPQLLSRYGNKINITYIPIVFPKQSTKSIEAYIIADQMGKGNEMQDALFNEAQAEISNGKVIGSNLMIMESVPALESVAASIGLGEDFNRELENGVAKDAAQKNLRLMNDYGIDGTPTLVINGNVVVTPTTDFPFSDDIEYLGRLIQALAG